ncbi:MAG: dTMP kinase [Gammaproteobacteria bacterium]|nr:dTMP kinase [Gammaproteobacteria bacterium]
MKRRVEQRGRFITLEGGEGVGKTTNLRLIGDILARRGYDVLVTREPGGTPLAEEIREVLLARRDEQVTPLAETLLVFAARAQHVQTVIEPALADGRWVLCDRFTDSTFAYQAGGRGLAPAIVEQLAAWVHDARWPDLTLYLDAPAALGMARIADRDQDRFEGERTAFFDRVRAVYRERARSEGRVVEIDASRPLAYVSEDVAAALDLFLAGVACSA